MSRFFTWRSSGTACVVLRGRRNEDPDFRFAGHATFSTDNKMRVLASRNERKLLNSFGAYEIHIELMDF